MSENRRLFLSYVCLDVQAGMGLSSGQGSDPVVMFRYSTDSGWTWSNERQMQTGKQGHYGQQVETWRLGYGRNFVFEFSGSDPNTTAILACYIRGEQGIT